MHEMSKLLFMNQSLTVYVYNFRERTTNTTASEVNIQGLKPGTEYEFRVVAVNRDGPSVTPTVHKVRTKQEGRYKTQQVRWKCIVGACLGV